MRRSPHTAVLSATLVAIAIGVLTLPLLPSASAESATAPALRDHAGPPAVAGRSPTPPPTRRAGDLHDATERAVLALVNDARAVARSCGRTRFAPVPPLRLEPRLGRAAAGWAQRMASEGFFAHVGPGGSTPPQRISATGYRWRVWGENLAAGQDTAPSVVRAWLESPGHCANIMSPHVVHLGIGHVADPGSPAGDYWVQSFAAPR